MATNMTPEQQNTFVKAAQLGVALGLTHYYEWFSNALRALQHGPYTEIPVLSNGIEQAFLAFEKGTASSPEEQTELNSLTLNDFYARVNAFYNRGHNNGDR